MPNGAHPIFASSLPGIPQLAVFLLLAAPTCLQAQPERPVAGSRGSQVASKRKAPTTIVMVQLITGDDVAGGLRAYRWTQVFEKLNVSLSIRRADPKDKIGVSERKSGDAARQVTVVGRLERDGRLTFADRAYSESDVPKLSAWLDELRTYGAQGSPEGRPAWGLTKEQFNEVHEALAKPMAADPKGRDLIDAIAGVQLPPQIAMRPTAGAEAMLHEQGRSLRVGQSLGGISQGTALAVLLGEHGLGYCPKRLANGSVELSICLLGEEKEVWPVGWPREQSAPATAPRLYEFTPIELTDIELDAVLDAAADLIGMPILLDKPGLSARSVDLSQVKVSHPQKRTTWGLALGSLLSQAKAKFELLIDESGRPFLWVTSVTTPRRPHGE